MYTWDVLKDNVKLAKILLTIPEPCLNHEFPREQLKNYHARKICVFLRGPSTWKVMPRMNWRTKTTQQLYKVSTPCLHDYHFQRRRISKSRRIVKSMLSNCSEMLALGKNWTTWYFMVSEQACTIDHDMDQSLWQTIISFDLLYSSHMWIQTILSCGKHCQTKLIGTVSRLRFRKRSLGFEIYIKWDIVRFRKSYICSNQLDV